MIVRTLSEIEGTERDVTAPTWYSRRFVLAGDGVGFSLHDTVMKSGTETVMWYKNHVEAVYCVSGEGYLDDLVNDTTHHIVPGTMYLLDGHERHRVRVISDLRMVCVFNPACTGDEVHDEEGVYPLVDAADGGHSR